MKTLKYLFYDNVNDKNTKELKVNTFEFDNKTKAKELYMELWNKFYTDEDDGVDFAVIDGMYNNKIDFDNYNVKLIDILEHCDLNNVIIIYAIIPIGATGAVYNGYRLSIHSDEQIHRYLPHVHVECGAGDTRINLNTLEIMNDDIFNSRKDKKKILGYLKDNQERWIGYYNSIVVDGIDPGIKIEKII